MAMAGAPLDGIAPPPGGTKLSVAPDTASASTPTDLTPILAEFLDRHLVYPLVEFAHTSGAFADEDMLAAKLNVIEPTHMVDFAMEIYSELHGGADAPAAMAGRRNRVIMVLQELEAEAEPLLKLLQDPDAMAAAATASGGGALTLAGLTASSGGTITADTVDVLYDLGKFQFECGNYEAAGDHLRVFRALAPEGERTLSALWGSLASHILMAEWPGALNDLNALKDAIDAVKTATPLNPLQQLQARCWLIHWALFVYFSHPDGPDGLVELLFSEKYLNAIQTNCPHIIRYLAVAVIASRTMSAPRRRSAMSDLVRLVKQESYTFKDPVTDFVTCLYVDFDFEGAEHILAKCAATLSADYFLESSRDAFVDAARVTTFETYARLHAVMDIAALADKLAMTPPEAEKWVVNLIRQASLDATMDASASHVHLRTPCPSVYEQVVDLTKGLSARATVLAANFDRKEGYTAGAGPTLVSLRVPPPFLSTSTALGRTF